MNRALILSLLSLTASAQTVQVYSEFARLSESGEVLAPTDPREILSPAVPRNAFSTFQIAIQVPRGSKYIVFIGQNPVDTVKVTLYRRAGERLEPAALPYESVSSQVLWLDIWVNATTPARRLKVEPQVFIDGAWITYPMEVRVSEVVVPDHPPPAGVASPFDVARAFLCGGQLPPIAGRVPIGADLQFRNAQQDVALLAQSSAAQREEARKVMGGCTAPPSAKPAVADAELYLRLRDLFFSPAWQKMRLSVPPR
jgi:hypothetical protein